MNALIGLSLWVVLATVVPGIITIAAVYVSTIATYPELAEKAGLFLKAGNEWVVTGIALVFMLKSPDGSPRCRTTTGAFHITLAEKYRLKERQCS